MRAFVLTIGAVVALGVAGCGKTPSAPAPAQGTKGAAAAKATPGATPSGTEAPKTAPEAPKPSPGAAGQPQASAPGAAAPKTAATSPVAGDRAKMGEAFVEIYCAQQAGEADKLLAIYKRYGFQDPKAWTKAWTEAAKDEAWIARLTERAVAKCPPKR